MMNSVTFECSGMFIAVIDRCLKSPSAASKYVKVPEYCQKIFAVPLENVFFLVVLEYFAMNVGNKFSLRQMQCLGWRMFDAHNVRNLYVHIENLIYIIS